jgi:hypothetical protein
MAQIHHRIAKGRGVLSDTLFQPLSRDRAATRTLHTHQAADDTMNIFVDRQHCAIEGKQHGPGARRRMKVRESPQCPRGRDRAHSL